ncbi:hypothetical protein B0J15DRAFT_526615 [Fusarium solani]|uniref:G domain-containing protein n=1 Tax=Fusarium solani TaxID=169388 RepID=A0A9P9HAV1_FUSSL|nr:uncharacterized protein B0J15DRAFT_526615 [Fusarium solani]KAH7253297.1 hypothetical protein B0J15DRAFT_526615 [Fusarium solani]
MLGNGRLRRLIVLVDGCELQDGKKDTNPSSIQRIKALVREGVCHVGGVEITQIPKYYTATASTPKLSDRWKPKSSNADTTPELIKAIVKDISSTLERPEDELWLYGSGHGAFVARAAAGIVQRLGLAKTASPEIFDDLYDAALALIKAQLEDDFKNGPQLIQKIKIHADEPPRIRFVGLFDTVIRTPPKASAYDISFGSSIEILRHALAINETRTSRALQAFSAPEEAEMATRSFIQAWFLGTHDDLIGGTAHDGLSLYPLQWIILESLYAGLSLLSTESSTAADNPMSLVFPQFAGNLPTLDGSEDIQWRLQFANGIRLSMFDIQSSHGKRSASGLDVHSLKLDSDRYKHSPTRKIFGTDGKLLGWSDNGPYGTMIHPSLFCVLDRYPRYLELPNLKALKAQITNFQDTYLVEDPESLAPWLRDMQLQASGVKAFRILVCGKTGVGKSTLINKVFGVEMTDESLSYQQGVHDINVAFESPKHPGLLIHDSRGWQAGSDTELDLIAKFLRHRAFQEDPAEALHVIWFCVDSDVARIEEADKRTFATIAQYSHQVPVFVVGTKKDKLMGYRKMQLLEEIMEETGNYKEAKKQAEEKASAIAEAQFAELRNQLSQIEHYKADGFCCLSKDDDAGIKDLLSQTIGLIADERVRLFCVAAQVVDVEQKINSAITECMRLGTHAVRTAAVPLPFTGMIGTPTVSRLICEHVLQCFGFPKTTPAEVEKIMSDVVMGNMRDFLKVSLTQFASVSAVAVGVAVPTVGIGIVVGAAGCLLGLPPTARMLLKCSCDMILILERSFRYDGKYVSIKQIEDAAKYYSKTTITSFSGKEKRLQQQVHDEINQLIPLKKVSVGFRFNKLRGSIEEIIYSNRFDNVPRNASLRSSSSVALAHSHSAPSELSAAPPPICELPGDEVQLPTRSLTDSDGYLKAGDEKLRPVVELPVNEEVVPQSLVVPVQTNSSEKTATPSPAPQVRPAELDANPQANDPSEEADGSSGKTKSGLRWSKPSTWKLSSRKSKIK